MTLHEYQIHLGVRFACETIRGAHEVVHLHSQGVEEVLGAGAITMGGDEVEPAPSAHRHLSITLPRRIRRCVGQISINID